MKKLFTYIILICILSILLFCPTICADGVLVGINLLVNSLIPAILPFIIFSNIVINMNLSEGIGKIFHPVIHKLFGLSPEGTYALLMGFICGYPIGSKILSDLYIQKRISKEEGIYLFRFINHASPAFIQGYIVLSLLNKPSYRIAALTLSYIPELLTGLLFRRETFSPEKCSQPRFNLPLSKILDDSISNAIMSSAKIGGYLIIFSVLSCLINSVNKLPLFVKILAISLTEITSGTFYISSLKINPLYLLFLCIIISSAGGFSTFFQIKSVIKGTGFSMKTYLLSKICTLIICALLCLTVYLVLF